jgi:hypothetical protein
MAMTRDTVLENRRDKNRHYEAVRGAHDVAFQLKFFFITPNYLTHAPHTTHHTQNAAAMKNWRFEVVLHVE